VAADDRAWLVRQAISVKEPFFNEAVNLIRRRRPQHQGAVRRHRFRECDIGGAPAASPGRPAIGLLPAILLRHQREQNVVPNDHTMLLCAGPAAWLTGRI
jgi:hypothetical protein